jgi:hypothetical protein
LIFAELYAEAPLFADSFAIAAAMLSLFFALSDFFHFRHWPAASYATPDCRRHYRRHAITP